jgi:hypothetical protein
MGQGSLPWRGLDESWRFIAIDAATEPRRRALFEHRRMHQHRVNKLQAIARARVEAFAQDAPRAQIARKQAEPFRDQLGQRRFRGFDRKFQTGKSPRHWLSLPSDTRLL